MNSVETKFENLASADRTVVDSSLYTGSIFGSQSGYNEAMMLYENIITGEIKDSLRSTPIMYKRDMADRVRECPKGTGIDFGLHFDHKFTRERILTVVVSENAGSWTYESSSKQDDGSFIERSEVVSATDIENLAASIVAEVSTDITYYANKRLTFK